MPRRTLTVVPTLLAIVALGLFAASCSRGNKSTPTATGTELADRWLRVGEDIGTGVDVYEGKLPPQLPALLNPGAGSGSDGQVALPVHPQGTLLGSFHIRRPDGTNLLWIIFDVPGADADVQQTVSQQLDATPWQVTGGQQTESLAVVRFQDTLSSDIQGTAVVQPLPNTPTWAMTVERGGKQVNLTIQRSAPVPTIDASLEEQNGGVVAQAVDPGPAQDAGLQANDQIVSIDGQAVKTLDDVAHQLHALGDKGDKTSSLVYILQIQAPHTPASTFVLPPSRSLPKDFPAPFLVGSGMTVLDVNWSAQAGQGTAYQVTLLSKSATADVAQAVRDVLKQQQWTLVNDQAVGFATQLDFANAGGDIQGRATVDSYADDKSYTSVVVQLQTGATPAPAGTPASPTGTGTATPAAAATGTPTATP